MTSKSPIYVDVKHDNMSYVSIFNITIIKVIHVFITSHTCNFSTCDKNT